MALGSTRPAGTLARPSHTLRRTREPDLRIQRVETTEAMARILIAGCGYVGARLGSYLVEDGDQVFGLKRHPERLPPGVEPVAGDVTDPSSLGGLPGNLDAVVYAVSPSGRSEEAYRAAYLEGSRNVTRAARARSSGLGRVLLVSSTGVYGHTDGSRVDEETPPGPGSATGRVLAETEDEVRRGPPPGIVLRLGGIYGPGRTSVIDRVAAGEAGCPPPDRYSNRIHRDDAAGAARHLLRLRDPEPLYLGVDREPAPLREVYRWIADRTGAADPCADPDTEAWEARGRRGTNKRCVSDRLAESGYDFRYPTYREGYAALLEARPGEGG